MSSDSESTIRVVLAIQHEGVRHGLWSCFAWMPDITVVGEACNWEKAVAQVRQLEPDVLLLDSCLAEDGGRPMAEKVAAFGNDVAILLLDEETSPSYVHTLLAEVSLTDCVGITAVDEIAASIRRLGREKSSMRP